MLQDAWPMKNYIIQPEPWKWDFPCGNHELEKKARSIIYMCCRLVLLSPSQNIFESAASEQNRIRSDMMTRFCAMVFSTCQVMTANQVRWVEPVSWTESKSVMLVLKLRRNRISLLFIRVFFPVSSGGSMSTSLEVCLALAIAGDLRSLLS
jgi:hypothetical protein